MIKSDEIKAVLIVMANLLSECNLNEWSNLLQRLSVYIDDDPEEAIYNIRTLYGGQGSLNDLVLYKNGKLLYKENDRFDELRENLYNLL